MGWKINVALIAGGVLVGLLAYEYKVRNSGPDCSSVTFELATGIITDDYFVRLQSWHKETAELGSSRPKLSFDHNGTQVTDVYLVPFTATGPMGSVKRFATLTCKSGSIEYSEQ